MAHDSETVLQQRMQADGMGDPQSVGAAQAVRQGPRMGRAERRGMKLLLPVNYFFDRCSAFGGPTLGTRHTVDHRVVVRNESSG